MKSSFLILCSVLFLISCEDSLNVPVAVNNFEQEFEIRPWQTLDANDRSYQFAIRTIEPQDCINSTLDVSTETNGNNIDIFINGVLTEGDCQEGTSYPEGYITFPTAPGIYNIDLTIGSTIRNSGWVEITDTEMTFNLNDDNGIEYQQDSVLRIDEGLTWGFIDDRVIPGPELNTVLTQIFQGINQVTQLPEGNYGHFVVGDLNVIEIYGMEPGVTAVILDTRHPDAWQILKNNLAEMVTKYPDLNYEFTRWDGLQIWN